MTEHHNSFAGQGPVLLDIGGDVGALVVTMPADLLGVEIEIRPLNSNSKRPDYRSPTRGHHHPHVAVVARPTTHGIAYTAVFPDLVEGRYELHEKLGGPARLQVTITGGNVQDANWPQHDEVTQP